MKTTLLIAAVCVGALPALSDCAVAAPGASSKQAGTGPVKVFILAGQSNMEGQSVVDLTGKDLKAPKLPVVIGDLTGAWLQDAKDFPAAALAIKKAQKAAAAKPEFKGSVVCVETGGFIRKPEDSPNPAHGHHEFGNAETYFLVGDAMGKAALQLLPK